MTISRSERQARRQQRLLTLIATVTMSSFALGMLIGWLACR